MTALIISRSLAHICLRQPEMARILGGSGTARIPGGRKQASAGCLSAYFLVDQILGFAGRYIASIAASRSTQFLGPLGLPSTTALLI